MKINQRCAWCEKDDLYRAYHDKEWGVPVYNDALLFEMLILESFQSGLSWYTILKKRNGFRIAFDHFDYIKISKYGAEKIDALQNDSSIIRNKLKISATINNAKLFQKIQAEHGSFADYIWSFVNHEPIDNKPVKLQDIPARTPLSDEIADDLKKRGFKFLGSTTIYAYMQAIGLVNDHLMDCWCRKIKLNPGG